MSIQKMEKRRRKAHDRTSNNIKKVFEELRRDSHSSLESDSTVVAVAYHSTETKSKDRLKRHLEPDVDLHQAKQRRFSDSSCVIIEDSDIVPTNEICQVLTPFKAPSKEQCSTPIKTDSKFKDLIVSSDTLSGNKLNNNSTTAQNFHREITDLTKEINADSYLTIDLTNETVNSSLNQTTNTVIDLANQTENEDCTLISVSDANLSMSGESDVTVLNMSHNKINKKKQNQIQKFARGIAKLDSSEKGKLLELITQTIFSGCSIPKINPSKQDITATIDTKKVILI